MQQRYMTSRQQGSTKFLAVLGMAAFMLPNLAGAQQSVPANRAEPLAIVGVSVVDVETGEVDADQTIVIRGGIIDSIGPEDEEPAGPDVRAIDLGGHFVIPGLWDMHVHIRGGADVVEENRQWLRQYIGFGVTGVRDAGGDLPGEVLAWREAIARGEFIGPRIFTSLQKLDGPTGGWDGSIRLASAADVAPSLDQLAEAGADFVKIYDGSIDDDLYLQTLREAERRGMKTASHVPLSIPFADIVAAGLDSVEHDFYLTKAASASDRSLSEGLAAVKARDESYSYFGMLDDFANSFDEAHARRTFASMVERGMAVTPTAYIGDLLNHLTDLSAHADDERLAHVPPMIRESFGRRLEGMVERPQDIIERDFRLGAESLRLIDLAADSGVMILAGSDTGFENSFLYPGDSLHHELAMLVRAGLSPLEALQATTISGARWMQAAEHFGSVEVDKVADLVVLERNPLDDIANTRSIAAVVVTGRFYDKRRLEELRTWPVAEP